MSLSSAQIAALRASLIAKTEACMDNEWQRDRLREYLEELPEHDIAREADVIASALSVAGNASAGLILMRNALRYDSQVPADLRALLVREVAKRTMTDGKVAEFVADFRSADSALAVSELRRRAEAPSLAGGHSLLVGAFRDVPHERWPPGPIHQGELEPTLGGAAYSIICRRLAALVEGELEVRLLEASANEEKLAAKGHFGSSARPAVRAVAKALLESEDEAACARFLAALDDEIRRFDIVNALEKRGKASTSPIASAVWRGDDGERVLAHLAALESGRFGILLKVGRRFEWIEGTADDVIATVPGPYFESAALAFARWETRRKSCA